MKTMPHASLVTFLLLGGFSRCFAMMSISHVSKEQAKELGLELRLKASGPDAAWVELEFKAEGQFKSFSHVSLEIGEGGKLLVGYAPLREKRSSSGNVVVGFMANRAFLEKVTLRVVVGVPMDMVGYDLRVRELVEIDKLH